MMGMNLVDGPRKMAVIDGAHRSLAGLTHRGRALSPR